MSNASDKSFRGSSPQAAEEARVNDGQHQLPFIDSSLMAQVLERENLVRALKQVKRNKGAAGVDGLSVTSLTDYLKYHWPALKDQLLSGTYRPHPVKRVAIPKADGRKRQLGIPTVVDRFIQQAIAQVLSRLWGPRFHSNSYGFRPQRSAHQAVHHARDQMVAGKRWVVDLELEAFFDCVNHDRLMHKLRQSIQDESLLLLIKRYLKAPIQHGQAASRNQRGVSQGGPLSPLLANIVLDELDWELERRGHCFARYADDCRIYVGSQRAGERLKSSLEHFIETRLRLKVNHEKSAVARPWKRSFLGFSFSPRAGHGPRVAAKALAALRAKVRVLTRRTRGHRIGHVIAELRKALLGWKAYFAIAEVKSPLRDMDKWIRRKLRCYHWKQWGRKGYRMLRRLAIERQLAWNTAKSAHGPWRLSASPALYRALSKRYFDDLALPSLAA